MFFLLPAVAVIIVNWGPGIALNRAFLPENIIGRLSLLFYVRMDVVLTTSFIGCAVCCFYLRARISWKIVAIAMWIPLMVVEVLGIALVLVCLGRLAV
jgi:hypothetical protein